jgi:hypothetical protein
MRIINKSLLKKIFGGKKEEVTGDWKKLHDEELHDLYSSSSIILVIVERKMAWAEHVAHMDGIKHAVVGKPDKNTTWKA